MIEKQCIDRVFLSFYLASMMDFIILFSSFIIDK